MALENICMQAGLCELSLSDQTGINPALRDWMLEKDEDFKKTFGDGIINMTVNRAAKLAKVIGMSENRARGIVFKVQSRGVIYTAQVDKKMGNYHMLTRGGQLALLSLFGVDSGVVDGQVPNPSQVGPDNVEMLSMVQRASLNLGDSCVGRYFNTRSIDKVGAIDKMESRFKLVVLGSTQPDSQPVQVQAVDVVEPPPVVVPQRVKQVPESRRVPPMIDGVNEHSFSRYDLRVLESVSLSVFEQMIDLSSRRNSPSDILDLQGGLVKFLELFGNVLTVDRAQGIDVSNLALYRNDTDLIVSEAVRLSGILTTVYRTELAKLPEEQRKKFEDPNLYQLWYQLTTTRKRKGLPT